MPRHELGVGTGGASDTLLLLVGRGTPDLAGNAGHQRSGRYLGALHNQRTCRNERTLADPRAVHHDGAHPDQDVILDGAAMEDRAVPDGDAGSDRDRKSGVGVNDRAVLEVAAGPDLDAVAIAAEDRGVPDADVFLQVHLAD